jgi:Tfp pilus assembly protein PilV
VEILVAVVFLAVCASAIVDGVWTANLQSSYALRRARVISLLQDQIETARGLASSDNLVNGSLTTPYTLPGFVGQVSVTSTSTLESTSHDLYDVTTTATWTEETSAGTRTDTATLSTTVFQ